MQNKTSDEILKESLEDLKTAKFNFACFVDKFERYVKRLEEERS